MTITLRDLLNDGKVHVLDGAMGTMLYSKGFFLNVCYDELNLKQPRLVREVHEEYVRAGAEILETNTFGANPVKLGSFGLADETEKINQAAAELARQASGGRTSVVGAIGPLGVRIEPFGAVSRAEAFAHFERQVKGLLAGGVDGFILETFSDLDEIHEALRAVRSHSDLPVIAQMTVGDDGLTHYGTAPETFAARLTEWGADVIGVNCSVGPAGVLEAVEKMVKATDRPISGLPNAGLPKDVGDRKIYLASPEYMASYARRMIEAGARLVGGCCGTTPEHIKKIRDYVASVVPRHPPVVVSRAEIRAPAGAEPVPLAQRSRWGAKIARGELVTSVEIVPPKGVDATPMLEQCRALKAAGVDAVNVPDGPRAQSRMGVLPSAILIQREAGIETVIHYCCRDRNLLGMLSDILGAHAAGLRNILIITGDPPKMGPYPEARRAVPHPHRRRHLAALEPAERRVPRERSPGGLGTRGRARADAEGAGEREGRGARRGRRDRARDVPAGEGDRAGGAGERAVRAGGGGAGRVRVSGVSVTLHAPPGAAVQDFGQSAPDIIREAARSPLGLLALLVLAVATLALVFFRKSSDAIKLAIFGLFFLAAVSFGLVVASGFARQAGPGAHGADTSSAGVQG